jgi:L-aspartate oxidase
VFLDMTHEPPEFLAERFPNIHAECLSFGIDMRKEPIPVVPAAHYMCGGVVIDLDGAERLPGCGPSARSRARACTAPTASPATRLLEGLVSGTARPAASWRPPGSRARPARARVGHGRGRPPDEAVVVTQNWDELRRFMWNYVGIVRSDRRLQRAARRIQVLQEEIREYYWNHLVTATCSSCATSPTWPS